MITIYHRKIIRLSLLASNLLFSLFNGFIIFSLLKNINIAGFDKNIAFITLLVPFIFQVALFVFMTLAFKKIEISAQEITCRGLLWSKKIKTCDVLYIVFSEDELTVKINDGKIFSIRRLDVREKSFTRLMKSNFRELKVLQKKYEEKIPKIDILRLQGNAIKSLLVLTSLILFINLLFSTVLIISQVKNSVDDIILMYLIINTVLGLSIGLPLIFIGGNTLGVKKVGHDLFVEKIGSVTKVDLKTITKRESSLFRGVLLFCNEGKIISIKKLYSIDRCILNIVLNKYV